MISGNLILERWISMSDKTEVIAMYNHKGGVGKTTTTINLCEMLAGKYNKKVLVIDGDCQNSLTYLANLDTEQYGRFEAGEEGMYDIGYLMSVYQRTGELPIYDEYAASIVRPKYTVKVRDENNRFRWVGKEKEFSFDLIPGYGKDLSLVEMLYVAPSTKPYILQGKNRNEARFILKYIVDDLRRFFDYDYIVIDCPPSLGILSLGALIASDSLIIPTTPDMLSTVGIKKIIDNLNELELYIPSFNIMGILFNSYTSNSKDDDELIENVREFGLSENIRVFDTKIPKKPKMREISSEEVIAVLDNTKTYESYRTAIDSLAAEVIKYSKSNINYPLDIRGERGGE